MEPSTVDIRGGPANRLKVLRRGDFNVEALEGWWFGSRHVDVAPVRIVRAPQIDQVNYRCSVLAASDGPDCVWDCKLVRGLAGNPDLHSARFYIDIVTQIILVGGQIIVVVSQRVV